MTYHYYSDEQLENFAEDLNRQYDSKRLKRPSKIDVYDIVDMIGARVSFDYLSPDRTYLGATTFENMFLYVWPNNPFEKGMIPKKKLFYKGTIIIDRDLNESNDEHDNNSENFTVIHECFHYIKHQDFFEEGYHLSKSFSEYEQKKKDKKDDYFRIEYQANNAASAFLMPKEAVIYGANQILNYKGRPLPYGDGTKKDIKELGRLFGVNYSPMLYRLKALNILEQMANPFI